MKWNNLYIKLSNYLKKDDFWYSYFEKSKLGEKKINIHLGIFIEPYLGAILEGKKTVESRFSINRIAPYQSAKKGDILLLKRSGGPICGIALITSTWYYELNKNKLEEIRKEFNDKMFIENEEFWESKSDACYASLLQIENAVKIDPLKISKKDRRGWVVLKKNNGLFNS